MTEAADDICYRILDLEDGLRLGLLTTDKFQYLLKPIAKADESKLNLCRRDREKATLLRAFAITNLVNSVTDIFIDNEKEILSGDYKKSLIDGSEYAEPLKAIEIFSRKNCYDNEKVLKIELAGYNVIGFLLKTLLKAIGEDKSKIRAILYSLLTDKSTQKVFDESDEYHKILIIVDIISGMTDGYAVSLYRQLSGLALPTI